MKGRCPLSGSESDVVYDRKGWNADVLVIAFKN